MGSKTATKEISSLPLGVVARPKVLVIDVSSDVAVALSAAKLNVAVGTFGPRYQAHANANEPVVVRRLAKLPNYTEQEIVVVDLTNTTPILPAPEWNPRPGERVLIAPISQRRVDTRPVSMADARPHFDRILAAGGVFVVFAADRQTMAYLWVRPHGAGYLQDDPK